MEGVNAETERKSLAGGLNRISVTTSLNPPDSSAKPVRGKLRGPHSYPFSAAIHAPSLVSISTPINRVGTLAIISFTLT